MAKQQKTFEQENAKYFGELEKMMPLDLLDKFNLTAKSALKNNRFFGPRFYAGSSNEFQIEIRTFGLQILEGSRKEGPLMKLKFRVKVLLLNEKGKKYLKKSFIVESSSAYKVSDFVTSPLLMDRVYRECLSDFQKQFSKMLDRKTGKSL